MSNEMQKLSRSEEQWGDCPPGTLRRMIGEVREAQRRAVMHRVTSVLAVAILVATGTWLGVQLLARARHDAQDSSLVNLSCAEVQQLLSKYGHGELAASVEVKIAEHLDHCEGCRVRYQQSKSPDRDQTRDRCQAPPETVAMAPHGRMGF